MFSVRSFFPFFATFFLATTILAGCVTSSTFATASHDEAAGKIAIDGSTRKTVATLYGENYWSWDGYGDNMPKIQPLVTSLKLNLLRAGGYNNDAEKSTGAYGSDPFGDSQIDTFVAYCKAVGAEPAIQVSLIDNYKRNNGRANPTDAAAIVAYCKSKSYKVKYWEIGNEPDLYGDLNNGVTDIPGYTVNKFINDFKAFASAMKEADSGIEILGPELSWKYYPSQPKNSANDWLTPFLIQCKGAYDIVAIHRYPFSAAQCSITNAMGDVQTYISFVRKVQALIASIAPAGIPLAITESNITWDGTPVNSVQPASPQTIFAAMWVADTLCAAREQGVWAQSYWSLSESWTLGFVDPSAMKPRPEYYGFQIVSNHMGPVELSSTPPSGFSIYASRNAANETVVTVLNKNARDKAETFAFANMVGSPAPNFTATFPAYSISCVTFPDDGSPPTILRYSGNEVSHRTGPVEVQGARSVTIRGSTRE